MPHRVEEGDAAHLLVRVGRIDTSTGLVFCASPRPGQLPYEWCGWDRHVVSIKLLTRAPEPRDICMPHSIDQDAAWKPGR